METVIAIILSAAGSLAAVYWQQINSWAANTFITQRIVVKRIEGGGDANVPALIELYGEMFPEEDGTNYSMEEFIQIMDKTFEETRHVKVENIVLVALIKKEVVGFIFSHFYPTERKAIISYFGIKKENDVARQLRASQHLLKRLRHILSDEKKCDALFFDLEGYDSQTPAQERHRRKGRKVLFRNSAKALGYKAREFQFSYHCPKVALTADAREAPFSLFCIGIDKEIPKQIDKNTMIEYLKFIYLFCYGDFYAISDPRFEEHLKYLRKSVDEYQKILPDSILAV